MKCAPEGEYYVFDQYFSVFFVFTKYLYGMICFDKWMVLCMVDQLLINFKMFAMSVVKCDELI